MYNKLEGVEKIYNGKPVHLWSDKDYLEAFSAWQNLIPERCWIEDY
jgi:hypothetical protein